MGRRYQHEQLKCTKVAQYETLESQLIPEVYWAVSAACKLHMYSEIQLY